MWRKSGIRHLAAVINVKINIKPITDLLQQRIDLLKDKEYLLRPVAFDCVDLMTQRIHIKGVASDGKPIGTYSAPYLKYVRPKFNRSKDQNVIVSLTRQLENDWSVIATDKGYGIGFKNPFNYKKARWVEAIKDRIIFDLSASEKEFAINRLNELAAAALK